LQKQNGELNEDEQILILSAVKEKMQVAANELVKIQEYDRFKELMDAIRSEREFFHLLILYFFSENLKKVSLFLKTS